MNDGPSGSDTDRSCPVDGCGNESLDNIDDPDLDWFCHWCGNIFVETEDGLDVQ